MERERVVKDEPFEFLGGSGLVVFAHGCRLLLGDCCRLCAGGKKGCHAV